MTCAVPDFPLSSIPASLSWPPVPPGSLTTPYIASVTFSMVGRRCENALRRYSGRVLQHVRLFKHAAGSDATNHAGELQRRGGNSALSGGDGDDFAGIPFAMKDALDPFLRRHQAGLFGRKIDAGFVADAKFVAVVGKAIDSQAHAHVVEKDVARFQNRVMQAQYAMRLRSGLRVVNIAMVLPPEERAVPGTKRSETSSGTWSSSIAVAVTILKTEPGASCA